MELETIHRNACLPWIAREFHYGRRYLIFLVVVCRITRFAVNQARMARLPTLLSSNLDRIGSKQLST
jgi:hypothetical protein